MAKISGSDIRPGMVIEHDGSLWVAVKAGTVKRGTGEQIVVSTDEIAYVRRAD